MKTRVSRQVHIQMNVHLHVGVPGYRPPKVISTHFSNNKTASISYGPRDSCPGYPPSRRHWSEHQRFNSLTFSNFHCLIHELYPTNHHSSLGHAIDGTSCVLLAFLNPTTCYLSNLRSINLISLSPVSLSPSFFLF